jgi:hypothetical protein|tara:strand:+ start:3523 stop:4164 length:642 start_codon:yes stop_codon:yes gene_type:complete
MKNNFKVLKNVISKEMQYFSCRYLYLKRQVLKTFREINYISPYSKEWGSFGDSQVKDIYCCYGDVLMEVLLVELIPLLQKEIKQEVFPTYSYLRIYEKGSTLPKHIDRISCEFSTTLNLGGDEWPIFLEDNGKTHKVILKPGDMLVYKGNLIKHWRNKFKGDVCYQVFFHYNFSKKDSSKNNLYDTRKHLGLPSDLAQEININAHRKGEKNDS